MKCKKVKKKLSAFIDNELKDKELVKIKQHLAICPICSKELKLLSWSWNALKSWGDIEAPDNFKEKFWQKIKEKEQRRLSISELIRRIFENPVPAFIILIFIIGVIVGNYLGNILNLRDIVQPAHRSVYIANNNLDFNTLKTFREKSIEKAFIMLISREEK